MLNLVSSSSAPSGAVSRAIFRWTRWELDTRRCGTPSSASPPDAHRPRSLPSIAARRSGSTACSEAGAHPSRRHWRSEAMAMGDLIQQIEETERLIAVYRNANEVIVGTEDQIYSRRGLINRTVLKAAEIGDTIVNILERRLAAMQAELEKLGRENHGESR